MRTKLLKKIRKNWIISLEPAVFQDEDDKYLLRNWNKKGEVVIFGTLAECLNYRHKIMKEKIKKIEDRIHNTICNRITE